VNIVEILCTHVCKWKNETCWNYSRNGERGDKGEDGGGELTMIYCKNFCKCHTVHPVQQLKYHKEKNTWASLGHEG
jgi:hypothetical protein